MGTGKKILLVLALLSVGGPIEAAGGGRVVRAAVRLQATVAARVEDPVLRASLGDAADRLVSDLRAAALADGDTRRAAYQAALERMRLLDAVVAYGVTHPARWKVLRAAAALERALMRATGSRPRRR